MNDSVTRTADESRPRRASAREDSPAHLFRVLDCDEPLAPAARSCLRGVRAVSIGRRDGPAGGELLGEELALHLPRRTLSSAHVLLRRVEDGWLLEDAGSKNGTYVFGERVHERLLRDGDVIEAGHAIFLFREALRTPAGAPAHLEASALPAAQAGLATLLPALQAAFDELHAIAPSRLPVVVRGESGTGKELAAQALHALSGRRGELVSVNCAAFTGELLRAELFGYKKNTFTGAVEDRPGLVRASDRGTLFLDEIGELKADAQAMLLRTLQTGEVLALGATAPVKVDLRVVSATHRDLAAMVAAGEFRADLLARLQGFAFELPPLRERREDLGLIIPALLARCGGAGASFLPEAGRALVTYGWPLNVRELEQALAAAVLLSRGRPIGLEHLPAALREPPAKPPVAPFIPDGQPPGLLALRAQVVDALKRHGGNVSAVAREMKKGRTQIQRWVRRFRIDPARPE